MAETDVPVTDEVEEEIPQFELLLEQGLDPNTADVFVVPIVDGERQQPIAHLRFAAGLIQLLLAAAQGQLQMMPAPVQAPPPGLIRP